MSGHDCLSHHHRESDGGLKPLTLVLVLTALYMTVEFLGGVFSNSLALIADAGHMLTDAGATGLALFAAWISRHPASAQKTYGYQRMEIIAAFLNGIALALISIYIVVEAFHRMHEPKVVQGGMLTLVAIGGLLVNAISAWILTRGGGKDVNTRAVLMHVFSDMLGSFAAIIAGVGVLYWQAVWLDPALSILIALLVMFNAWKLIEEATHVLLEGCPTHIEVGAIRQALTELPEIETIHDLHVWTITQGKEAMSVHVVVSDRAHFTPELVVKTQHILKEQFGLTHITVQIETPGFEEDDVHF